ncbi:uncharacterized protein [Hetaerina americana]|uniref:uncharacterized protein n=1 Tax=Hetaerina americana TaxID=62018 RepID=UPI003A7F598A
MFSREAQWVLRGTSLAPTPGPARLRREKRRRFRLVVNLTDQTIDETTSWVLAKGLNFAPAPRTIPYSDIIGSIEQAVRKLPGDSAEEVRNEISLVLKRAVPPKPNVTREERAALYALRRNADITILPADKGNATVLMKTEDYHQKIREMLSDEAYRRLLRDPTDTITRKTPALMMISGLPIETIRHKEGTPLHPIVSAIRSPTYNLAKHLTGILAPFVGPCENHVKNSAEFLKTLEGIQLETIDIMVSFDVVFLFTRVLLADTLLLLERRFDSRTVKRFHLVLTSTNFLYDGKFYEQTDGVAMESPLSPVIASFFMEDFEEKALNSAPMGPKCFFRYVDGTFIIWPHGLNTLNAFLEHMNNQHPNIRFAMEIVKNHRLPFLDILIHRKRDGRLGHSVYRKPTHTDPYLNGNSHHHPAQRDAVLSSLIHRAKARADKESLPAEIKHLKKTLLQNGYGERQNPPGPQKGRRGRQKTKGGDGRETARHSLPTICLHRLWKNIQNTKKIQHRHYSRTTGQNKGPAGQREVPDWPQDSQGLPNSV